MSIANTLRSFRNGVHGSLFLEAAELVDNSEKYKLALELALILLHRYEPGDSRAVSDDFVAMAAILSDANTSDDCVDLIRQSIIRESGL